MNRTNTLASTTVTIEEASLSSLYYWLQYEKHTWILGAGIGLLPYGIILSIVSILATIFTPFLLWHLFKAKWYKAIIIFNLIVIIPSIICYVHQIDNLIISFSLRILPLVTFYLYAYVISYFIKEHLNKLQTLKKWTKEHLAD